MNKNIVILKNDKKIFKMKIKTSKKSALGDYDIIIEAGKNMNFDHVVLGDYYRHFYLPKHEVRYISWHGFYEIIDAQTVLAPVVRIKDGLDRAFEIRHSGSINVDKPCAFPVCSLYIPKDLDTDNLNKTKRSKSTYYLDVYHLKKHKDVRIDFFVLPKNLSNDSIKNSPLKIIYHYADLEIYNRPENGYNIILDSDIYYLFQDKGFNIFYRIVNDINNLDFIASRKRIFTKVSSDFSLIINDPNDIYNKVSNFIIIKGNDFKSPTTLIALHEESLKNN